MPSFPWKKAKFGGISRLVSDVRSRRRKSSTLLVETGFPTSLADLIVKNSNRLKKPKNFNSDTPSSSISQSPTPAFHGPPQSEVSEHVSSPSSISEEANARSEVSEQPLSPSPSLSTSDDTMQLEVSRTDPTLVESSEVSRPSCFMGIVVKVFFVVVLALGTKQLALGITTLAFALFFLEFMGKRLLLFEKPPAVDGIRQNECKTDPFEHRLGSKFPPLDWKREVLKADGVGGNRNCEIEAIDSNLDANERQRRLDFPASYWKGDAPALTDCKSTRAVGKAGIQVYSKNSKAKVLKKFVPKVFRRSKSRKHVKAVRGKMSNCREQEEDDEDQEYEQEDEDMESPSNDVSVVDMEDEDVGGKNVCRITKCNANHLFFLVVVLWGLTGGRAVALVLTIVYHLLVKMVETAWRNLKMNRRGLPLL